MLTLAMIFVMASCGNTDNGTPQNTLSTPQDPSSSETDNGTASTTEDEDSLTDSDSQSAGADETPEQLPENSDAEDDSQDGTSSDTNILVAYFSRVGNTDWEDGVDAVSSASLNVENGEYVGNAEVLARFAQEATGGDLFLIQTAETYPSDYRQTTDKAAEEQDADARPELSSHVEDMDAYDTVILIYPNWWGTLPQPLFTFLEEYDFSGKTILPLCTHAGSRMGRSEGDIRSLCPDAILLEGLAVSGSSVNSAQSDVEEWISSSGILE